MRFLQFVRRGRHGIAVEKSGSIHGLTFDQESYPGSLKEVLAGGSDVLRSVAADLLQEGEELDPQSITFLPPVDRPDKIVCVGLNYQDHTAETDYKQPDYPALFARFSSSLVGHDSAIVRPQASDTLDYEGELAVVIGGAGRHIPLPQALSHVAGYSIFNDGSVREYQHKTPQWTVGKNFDGTGAFGPVLVTSDELPGGARGLSIETRLNGSVVQSSNTDRLIFDVATLISTISQAISLSVGDVLVTGTPSGIGHARNPKLYLKPGDVCEIEIAGIGVLRNTVADEFVAGRDIAPDHLSPGAGQ